MKKLDVYRCELCGNLVEVVSVGGGTLSCCGQPMKHMVEQTADATTEKHVPVVIKENDGFRVKVGSVPHPMLDAHSIQWIELLAGDRAYRQFLHPGQPAEAFFAIEGDHASAREYCNLHGLWRA